MAPASYRYLLCDLLTRTVLYDNAPLSGVSFSEPLAAGGQWQATVDIDPDIAADVLAATRPHETALYVERSAALRFGGPVLGRSGVGQLALTGAQFDAWASAQLLVNGYAAVTKDIGAMVADWLAQVQGFVGGNIGVHLIGSPVGVTYAHPGYAAADAKTLSEAISETLGQFGVEWGWDVAFDSTDGLPRVYLTLGTRGGGSTVMLDRTAGGGNIISYQPSEDASQSASVEVASGQTATGEVIPAQTAVSAGVTAGTRTRWTRTASYPYGDAPSVARAAVASVARTAEPVAVWTFTVDGQGDPDLSAIRDGCMVRCMIEDVRHPGGLDATGRCTQVDVKPAARGTAIEEVTVSVDLTGKV